MSASVRAYLRQHHVALVAVFLALTGTAVALPGKNKVDSGDIKNGQVKLNDLAADSVDSQKVANGSLLSEDFAAGQLLRGATGPQGPQGLQGPAGTDGSPDTAAQVLSKLQSVDGSGSGLDADTVDGGGEAFHEFDPPNTPGGEPDLGAGWSNLGGAAMSNQGLWSTAGFYRDPLGIVHLKGVVTHSAPTQNMWMFELPPGYRPDKTSIFTGATDGSSPPINPMMFLIGSNSQPAIGSPGVMIPFSVGNAWVSLDSISFRCSPSGVAGCP